MTPSEIPQEIASAIDYVWNEGVIQEFDIAASPFQEIRGPMERDLLNLRAALLWQTPQVDAAGEPPPDWQSYHVFFLAPAGVAFNFQVETQNLAAPESPDDGDWTETIAGQGFVGLSVAVSLAAPFAVINPCSYTQFEDGSESYPEIESFLETDAGEPVDVDDYHRDLLGVEAFQVLDDLRGQIVDVLNAYDMQVMDRSVAELPLDGLGIGEGVLLEPPLRVMDAFFFTGA